MSDIYENGKKIYDRCKGTEIGTMLWRNAFLTKICGVCVSDDIDVFTLNDKDNIKICAEQYTEAFAHLLILYGAGYVDKDTVIKIAGDAEKYEDIIFQVEKLVIEEAGNAEPNRTNAELVTKMIAAALNYSMNNKLQAMDFDTARILCDNKCTTIRGEYVYPKDESFLTYLTEVGEVCGKLKGNDILILNAEQIRDNNEENAPTIKQILNKTGDDREKPGLPFIINASNVAQIIKLDGMAYAVEFVVYAKEHNIPFDSTFETSYKNYVRDNKMKFSVSAISRKRYICDTPNWFDYCAMEYSKEVISLSENFDKHETIDISKRVGDNVALDEKGLVQEAIEYAIDEYEPVTNMVIELTHGDKKYLYYIEDKKPTEIDSNEFRRIPFDYNNIWTTIMEWSRDKKIVKKNDRVIIPDEEWQKIDPKDRDCVQRLIEEQYAQKKNSNKMLQTLSQLKAYAEDKSEKDKKRAEQQAELQKDRKDGVEKNEGSGKGNG